VLIEFLTSCYKINLFLNLNLMVVESNMYAAPDEDGLTSAAITIWSYHYVF